jgi:hypothetical protein
VKKVSGAAAMIRAKIRSALAEAERIEAEEFGPVYRSQVAEAVDGLKTSLTQWDELSRPVEIESGE